MENLRARAARAHAVTCNATYGDALYDGINNATEFVTTWHSDVTYDDSSARRVDADAALAAWASWDVAAWGLDGRGEPLRGLHLHLGRNATEPWAPMCEAVPRWQATNFTLWRTVTTGPEDPKLVGGDVRCL